MRLRWPFVMRWELEVAEEMLDWYRKRCQALESTKNQLYAEVARLKTRSASPAFVPQTYGERLLVDHRPPYDLDPIPTDRSDPRLCMSMPMGLPGCHCSK